MLVSPNSSLFIGKRDLSDSVIPWWSEFLSGGITEQLRNWLGWERKTKVDQQASMKIDKNLHQTASST